MASIHTNHPDLWRDQLPALKPDGHKYDRGHAAIIGGNIATGAARLASRAALRSGAGLVSVICAKAAFPVYAAALEAVMVKPQKNNLAPLLKDKRITAWLIGPGEGTGSDTRGNVLSILKFGRNAVLDADALNSFERDPDTLFAALNDSCVITPHSGEFERLFGEFFEKLSATQQAANQSGAIVVHKGAPTIIAAPDGRYVTHEHAPPSLATAGSGDVLAGIITGLIAQGMEAFDAACAACWLHGEAAHQFGAGLIAEDLPDLLPKALQSITPSK